MAAVAQLKAVLGMDSKDFKAGMSKAGKDVSSFQSKIKSVGKVLAAAFSVGAIVSAGKSIAGWASGISEAAQNTGILTKEMLALNHIAIQGGLEVGNLQSMLGKLAVKLSEAADGNETARKAFDGLNLSVDELAGLDPVSMLQKVAKAAINSGDPVTKLADIFGEKLGVRTVSALRDIAENGLPEVSQAAADAADEIERLGDKWDAAMEGAKRKTLELTMSLYGAVKAAAQFAGGATSQMSGKEMAVRAGLAVVTGGLSLIPSKSQRALGSEAVNAEQRKQEEEKKKREDDSLAERKAAQEKRAEDIKARNQASIIKDNEKAYKAYAAIVKKDEKDIEDRKKARITAIEKWRETEAKKSDIRRAGVEKEADIRQKFSETINPVTSSRMSPDSMARVGGFFGGERAGYDVQSRQLEVLTESRKMLEAIAENTAETKEQLYHANGGR